MSQEFEPMEVEEDASNFDELIGSELKSNPASSDSRDLQNLPEAKYENKGGTFLTGIDIFSAEEKQKIEERAKRFGLNDEQIFSRLQEYQDLYTSMGITEENENTKNFRLNVLHIRGTEEMSTKDVFKYFEDYAPASIEWINDVSCNVVWVDSASAARALVGLSKKIAGIGNRDIPECIASNETNSDCAAKEDEENFDEQNNTKNSNNTNDAEIHVKDIDYPLPPGIWRKGINYPKSKGIFMRFATRTDKKQPRAEKMSEYYKKYGNPNFGGVKGILTESRKRTLRQTTHSKKKVKGHSSDEEMKVNVKNPWGDLSQNWGVGDTVEEEFIRRQPLSDQSSHIKERLGLKSRVQEKYHESDESESESSSDSEDDEWFKKSKIPRMRMRADDEEAKVKKRRIKQQQQEVFNAQKDLRSRLGKIKKEPVRDAIQVVITNYDNSRGHVSEEEEGEIVESENEEQVENREEEQEEGEIDDAVEENEEEEESNEKEEGEESDNDDEDEDVDEEDELSEKEVRGPKGSVIKVMPRKPRIASTVWTRLHRTSVKSEVKAVNNSSQHSSRRDLRETLRGDLRSRLGAHSRTKGRSPLRIEVKNDKCAEENSGSE